MTCEQLWSTDSPVTLTLDAVLREADADFVGFTACVDIFQDDSDQPSIKLQARERKDNASSPTHDRAEVRILIPRYLFYYRTHIKLFYTIANLFRD